ncbi:MAG: DUF3501 family protein [Ilumatobacteraceae bacterium]
MTTPPNDHQPSSRKLTIEDIADVRAYERERAELRARVMELKKRRRVALGTLVSITFENRETVRYQIQEMARVERLATDAAIQEELDTYNPMIPEPGQLCCTMFIELTTEDQLREWLPKLAGIERTIVLKLADGSTARFAPEAGHDATLTRDETTAAVHFLQASLTPDQVASLEAGPAQLVCEHPAYLEVVELADTTLGELRADVRQD